MAATLGYPPPKTSWLQVIDKLPIEKRQKLNAILHDDEALALAGDFFLKARREQLEPEGDWWFIWLIMAGRGFGKNFSGSNWLIDQHLHQGAQSSIIIAATANDLRDYCIEGDSGVLNQAPDHFRPVYKPSVNALEWPNGTKTTLRTSEKPERVRGGNFDRAWCDELSHWNKPELTWNNLQFALRLGKKVKVCVTMTPRPTPMVKKLLGREGKDAVITRGSTYDNIKNLSEVYIEKVVKPFEGTSLGRQELEGAVLMDVDGALWNHAQLEKLRRPSPDKFKRVVIAVDPAVTTNKNSDETGIIAAGSDDKKFGYVLADYSGKYTPDGWVKKVIDAYYTHEADRVIAEVNNGGDLVKSMIHSLDPSIPVTTVHATRGKVLRADPVAQLYEQGRVFHTGVFALLEDQMCLFVPGEAFASSPDRVDALVYAITHLLNVNLKKGRAGLF